MRPLQQIISAARDVCIQIPGVYVALFDAIGRELEATGVALSQTCVCVCECELEATGVALRGL
jgi:hypothetical protein